MIEAGVSAAARWSLQALAASWSLDVRGDERLAQLRLAGQPFIFALWHASLLAPLWHRRGQGIALLVSRSRDAAPLARAARVWGYRVVGGSSSRGAFAGLRSLVRTVRAGRPVAITPDGPRGPARCAKPGVLAAARLTGALVVPVGVASSAEWRAASWDGFRVPHPFARVRIVYGRPVAVADGDTNELTALLDATEEAACVS
ncbi:MAG: lysophospholipid acyltransferase family protein [Gemmatimonadales bacterium]|jgi:lysophospholipid acyltransferase (LPLAT)-like uncharacterized protein